MTEETLKIKRDLFVQALKDNLLNISLACKERQITRVTYYRWLKNKEFKDQVDNAEEYMKDMMESALKREGIKGGVQAIKLWLETHAKDRGYGQVVSNYNEYKSTGYTLNIIAPDGSKMETLKNVITQTSDK